MNLFENLQMMKESENSIVSEFKEFLVANNAQYIANEIGETKDGMQLVIYDGDWKHEHRYMQNLINEFFENKGINIEIYSEEIGVSESDTFSARYDIEFNNEPLNYNIDIKSVERVKESNDSENTKLDLRNYTVKEFSEMINEDNATVQQLMRDCSHCSNVSKPYEAVTGIVKNSKVAKDNVEIVSKFIHANLFNNSPHRFYNGRGYGPTLRKTV